MLIVDMPIPEKSCFECACIDSENGRCQADKEQRYVDFNIPNWCPIKGELVTCGECKHWDEKPLIKNEKGMTRFGVCRLWHDGYLKADFYCADGERKD